MREYTCKCGTLITIYEIVNYNGRCEECEVDYLTHQQFINIGSDMPGGNGKQRTQSSQKLGDKKQIKKPPKKETKK